MTDERMTPESDTGRTDVDPTFDPMPVFGDGQPAAHAGHPVLRRALDHAPDRGNEPTDELRQAIRSFAHESVAPSLPSGRTGLLGRRGSSGATGLEARTRARRGRLMRNLIVAAVLVVIAATVAWHREPSPGVVRPAATAPDAAVAPTTSAASASTSVAPSNAQSAASAAAGAPPALSEAEKILFAPRVTLPPTLPEPASPALSASASASPNAARVALPSASPTTSATALPKAPVPALPSAAAPVPGATADRTPATTNTAASAPGGRATASFAAPASTTATPAPAAAPPAEAPPPGSPTFAALSQWTQLTMTRADGSTRRRSKADVRELGALLSSAALAGAGAEPVKGRVDWRVSLERNGQTLARVELAGNQVRWTENGAAPGTGTPPAGSLDSVREMLEGVFEEPAPGAASRPAPVPVEVQPR
jgi:hypothetical protein